MAGTGSRSGIGSGTTGQNIARASHPYAGGFTPPQKLIVHPTSISLFSFITLLGQNAAISFTGFESATSPGNNPALYRVSWEMTLTQAASGSSTLGGPGIQYTDPTTLATVNTPTGGTSTANVVGTQLNGVIVFYAAAGTNVLYQTGYVSVGVTPMLYRVSFAAELIV